MLRAFVLLALINVCESRSASIQTVGGDIVVKAGQGNDFVLQRGSDIISLVVSVKKSCPRKRLLSLLKYRKPHSWSCKRRE